MVFKHNGVENVVVPQNVTKDRGGLIDDRREWDRIHDPIQVVLLGVIERERLVGGG